MPDHLDDVQRLLSHDAGSLLVADADGAIVGALIAASDGWRGNMYRLAVHVEHGRVGVGLASYEQESSTYADKAPTA